MSVDLTALWAALDAHGLVILGHAQGRYALIGPKPGAFWAVFSRSPEALDGAPDPIDRWSRRIGDALSAAHDAPVHYPFGGPPYAPFMQWAMSSGRFHPSPIGPLVHEEHGLWASFRFALELPLASSPTPAQESPCERCADRPCATACPVGAIGEGAYDRAACAAHIASEAGRVCRETGCLARHACPVGLGSAPEPARAAHHMAAFIAARRAEGSL